MREKTKLWACRSVLSIMFLILGFTQANAWYIYVDKASFDAISDNGDGNLYLYTWNGIDLGNWPGAAFTETVTDVAENEWLFMDVKAATFNYKLNLGNGKPEQSANQWNGGNHLAFTLSISENNLVATSTTIPTFLYTVAGSEALFGSDWDIDDSQNNMTNTSGTTWTWKKEGVQLSAGTIEFKVIKGHNYSYGSWPFSNYVLNIEEAGNYDVTIIYDSSNNNVNAIATKIPEVVYLFGSVGKSEAWYYSDANPKLLPDEYYENYTGIWDVNEMPSYTARDGQYGLFLLTTKFGTDWNSTKDYMIGTASTEDHDHYWIDGGNGHYGEELEAIAGHTNGWTLPSGTYSFTYNRKHNWLKVEKYDGPVIYVYDYTRPYIYVKDGNGTEFNGAQPGAPILNLDESVGGHSGMSEDGDITKDGTGKLGWYKFAVPSNDYPITFDLKHNGDNQVSTSEFVMEEGDRAFYCYWTGSENTKFAQLTADDPDHLRRIVAHVRVQGTTVPTCNGVEMNGPSSFYGQMYYWMAVTNYQESFKFIISDGNHSYTADAKSDFYIELGNNGYEKIEETELEQRLANKTGRGTIIHLLKNDNTPTDKNGYVLGIETRIHDDNGYHNSTNLGATWWGASDNATLYPWKGIYEQGVHGWSDGVITNYDNSRYIYMSDGINGNPDVYTITAENGTEWYTWYSDRSTATINFGYGNAQNDYPTYTENESIDKFFATYSSPQPAQTAGEVWYVWTPNFDAQLSNGQSTNNGTLLDVTRTYESRAKQKAMCSTERDGNFVYYTDIKGWGDANIYCYVWDKNGNPITEWPGVKMTKVGYDDEGHPVYLADLSNYDVTNAGNIIFNNGITDSHATNKRQTGDLEWANGGCYDYLGLLYRIGGNIDVIENEPNDNPATVTLRGVWYSRVTNTLFAKDDNNYNNKSVNGYGYTDYAKATDLQTKPYDQSNWVEIRPYGDVTEEMLFNLINKEFVLYGMKRNSVNPLFDAITINVTNDDLDDYTPNKFVASNFMSMYQTCTNGTNYFFVQPKPNEFVEIDRSIFVNVDADNNPCSRFVMNTNSGLEGSFNVDWTYHDPTYYRTGINTSTGVVIFNPLTNEEINGAGKDPKLSHLTGYSGWLAIVKVNEPANNAPSVTGAPRLTAESDPHVAPSAYDASVAPSAEYTVYPICLDDDLATAIESIDADKATGMRTLKATRYYNLMGVESATPFQGVNIIVKEYSDGTRDTSKVIMK